MMFAIVAALAAVSPDPSSISSDVVTPKASAPLEWSAGVAFGAGFVPARTPLTVFGERRFGDSFHVGVTIDGGFTTFDSTSSDGAHSSDTTLYYDAGAFARYVVNPADPLAFAVSATITGGQVQDLAELNLASYVVAGALGIDVEHWFTPSFALRLSTPVVVASAAGTQAPSSSSIAYGANVAFAPSMAAVIAF